MARSFVLPPYLVPMDASPTLQAILRTREPLPRTKVINKLWKYILRHGLQDKHNRRNINCDEKLRKLFFGKKQVSMFEMTKLVSKHLTPNKVALERNELQMKLERSQARTRRLKAKLRKLQVT